MSIFNSLGWFKSEAQKERESLELEEKKLKIEALKREREAYEKFAYEIQKPFPIVEEKPYINIRLVNDVLTIVLTDGNILTKPNATQEDFQKARKATEEVELFKIATCGEGIGERKQKEEEIARNKALLQGLEILEDLDDFYIEDDSVYLVGVKRTIPQLLVEEFVSLVCDVQAYTNDAGEDLQGQLNENEEYQALKKFWLKCCLNPNAQSAEDLYKFLSNHQFKIDRHGNFYAYRRVVNKSGVNKEFVEFVSNAYNKVKAVWKKKPIEYHVWQADDGEYSFNKDNFNPDGINKLHGNLQELYLDLPNYQENMYTSAHTGQEDYKVGEVISMPRNEGNDDNSVSCSRGFHAASKEYNYSGFGDTPILVIINPMDVLAVPLNEVGKLRTCRWFFATTLPEEEEHILDDEEFDTMELGDVFEEKCSENLQGYVQNSFAEEVKRHTFSIPEISTREINNIILSLEEMKDSISDRVVQFD